MKHSDPCFESGLCGVAHPLFYQEFPCILHNTFSTVEWSAPSGADGQQSASASQGMPRGGPGGTQLESPASGHRDRDQTWVVIQQATTATTTEPYPLTHQTTDVTTKSHKNATKMRPKTHNQTNVKSHAHKTQSRQDKRINIAKALWDNMAMITTITDCVYGYGGTAGLQTLNATLQTIDMSIL